MKAHSIECCHRARKLRSNWSRGAAGGVLFAALAALMPKCPMCIAAWLGVLGLSGLAARVDRRALWLAAAPAGGVAGAGVPPPVFGGGDTREGAETWSTQPEEAKRCRPPALGPWRLE